MEKRKIALIASSWDAELLANTVNGIKKRLAGTGTDVYVFMCFPAFGLDSPEYFANFNICSLPCYEDYDGFIFSVNVVQGYDMIEKYHPGLLSCGKPMVSLDYKIDGIPSVLADGYSAEYRVVEHLIKEHGCREINYVGGMPDHPDNIIRKKAYMDALKANGIEIEENRIREYVFLESNGRQAYADFKELGIETPDAVVCANDAMALGYCLAAEEDGLYPPEAFLIAGFDDDDNAKAFTPMLSTVGKDVFEMGYIGCDALLHLIKGDKVSEVIEYAQKPVLRGSCGCYSPEEIVKWDNRQLRRQIYYKVKDEAEYYDKIIDVSQKLGLSDNEGLFNYYMIETMSRFKMYGFALCINQDLYYGTQPAEFKWETGYDEELYVISGLKFGLPQEDAQLVSRRDLVPAYLKQQDDEVHDYIFVPLHKFGASLGYLALVDGTSVLSRQMLRFIISAINTAYTNLRNMENMRKLNKRLDAVYVKDALTDMYNRFGYMRDGYAMFEKSKVTGRPLMVMFMDMDRLKDINDIFGHSQGDTALVLFSGVLKKCTEDDMIAVRYGGDEFLIIGTVEDDAEVVRFREKLLAEIKNVNDTSGLPYEIEASIGYVLTDAKAKKELDDYVKEADELMYEVKKRNRKNRKSFGEA